MSDDQSRLGGVQPGTLEAENTLFGEVWVVVYRRMDDPHPHVAGVYTDEDDADEKMRECEDTHSDPGFAVAWEKERVEVE